MAGSCTQMRRRLVRHSALNISTGETSETRSEWVTEPCNVPLFGDAGDKCRSCLKGWTHPENYPVETGNERNAAVPEPLRSIVNAFSAGVGR